MPPFMCVGGENSYSMPPWCCNCSHRSLRACCGQLRSGRTRTRFRPKPSLGLR